MLMALHPTRPAFSDSASEETRFFNLIFRSWNKEIRISIWTHYDLTMSCCNAILSYGFYEWYRPALVRACCQIKVWWWGDTLHPTTWIWNLADNLPFAVFLSMQYEYFSVRLKSDDEVAGPTLIWHPAGLSEDSTICYLRSDSLKASGNFDPRFQAGLSLSYFEASCQINSWTIHLKPHHHGSNWDCYRTLKIIFADWLQSYIRQRWSD